MENVAVETRGYVDPGIAVLAPGFEQQYARRAVGGQAVGQYAPHRPCPDNDEIEFRLVLHSHSP
jgi:hypothetical protein